MSDNENVIRCKRCNKVLKSAEAQQRGYGTWCWRQYLAEQQSKTSLFTIFKQRRG